MRHQLRMFWTPTPGPVTHPGPALCFDGTATQLLADTREPPLAKPAHPRPESYEYRSEARGNLFPICEPRAGWRHVAITRQGNLPGFSQQMRWRVDEVRPGVAAIRLALQSLNTHRMASRYDTFPAPKVLRLARRREFHHTPRPGGWLNPVLGLPKGWQRLGSAQWPAPAQPR